MMQIEKIYEVEERLAHIFQSHILVVISSNNTIYIEKKVCELFDALNKEMEEIDLESYTLEDINNLIYAIENQLYLQGIEVDFDSRYFSLEFSPWVRIYYLLQAEWMNHMNVYFSSIKLTEEEKYDYYQKIFHYRIVESFHKFHERGVFLSDEEYLKLYYQILYTFPGLEDIFLPSITLSQWLEGESISLEDYFSFEKKELIEHFQNILEDLDSVCEDEFSYQLTNLSYLGYFYTYALLLLESMDFEDFMRLLQSSFRNKERCDYLRNLICKHLDKKTKTHLRLVRKSNTEYNKKS